MTTEEKQEWLQLFDKTCNTFKWFWTKYGYSDLWILLIMEREYENIDAMKRIMNDVWFELPDGRFNIMVNPKGWSEFLNLIEE
jgi:hypothetical protein